jgi:hypothetical protein
MKPQAMICSLTKEHIQTGESEERFRESGSESEKFAPRFSRSRSDYFRFFEGLCGLG